MTQSLNMANEISGLIDEMGILVKYYEGRLASGIADNKGSFTYKDGDTMGCYYKPHGEYKVLRSGIDYKKLTEKVGQILQGGCSLIIPKKLKNHHAIVTSQTAITTVDLSTEKNITLQIDGGSKTTIDCSANAVTTTAVTIHEIISNLNNAGLGDIAYESSKDGGIIGTGFISIRSLKTGANSSIILHPSASNDAQYDIIGIPETNQVLTYKPSKSSYQLIELYNKVSRVYVFILNSS